VEVTEFRLAGKTYIRCKDLTASTRGGRTRTAHCWKWGEDIRLKERTIGTSNVYYCYLCERMGRTQELPVVSTGRTTATEHLVRLHKMDKETGELHTHTRPATRNQPNLHEYGEQRSLSSKINFESFKRLLVRWIVCCHIAFFQFENTFFRAVLDFLYPGLDKYLPKAASTIRKWVIDAWQAEKRSLRAELKDAHSAISLSFDLWTSPNGHAVLGVCGHFISQAGRRRTVVLALREVLGDHGGENIAQSLLAVIRDYGFQGNVGYFMADNAESNDVTVDLILRVLYPNMSAKHRKARRLRCFGHIVNLCAQDFIVGEDADKICRKIQIAYQNQNYGEVQRLWKQQGAIGMMQNLIRYIRNGPQRRGFFRRIKKGGLLAEWDGLEVSLSIQFSNLNTTALSRDSQY